MSPIRHFRKTVCALLLTIAVISGYENANANDTWPILGGVAGGAVMLGMTPTNSLEQIYYLGVFDPQEQVDPMFYRVVVRGQASAISFMKFASGWVPADTIDSLNSDLSFSKSSNAASITPGQGNSSHIEVGRRLVLFGPEGFREAPRDHRLAIVMGASPENFFKAVNQALGTVSEAKEEQLNSELRKKLFEALLQVKTEKDGLNNIESDFNVAFSEKSDK